MSSSSSSTISATTVNGTTRYTGLSSGIDVNTIVTELMTAEKAKKLNKLEQKEQLAEWKQDDYRTIISDIQTFSSKYFDVTSSSSLLSTKNFSQYTVTSNSDAVTATYTSAASAGSHTVAVSQLATAATLESSANLSKDVTGDSTPDYSSLSGKSILITVDGTESTVSLSSVTSLSTLQTAIDDAVGSGKLTVSTNSSGYLTITAADSGVDEISISDPSSGTSGLSSLGFDSSATTSNRLSTSDTLEELASALNSSTSLTFDSSDAVALTINGTSFSFDKSTTLSEMMTEINDSSCGATMKYDETSGKLVLTADSTGAGNTLSVTESGSNFLTTCLSSKTAGTDAKMTIDGKSLTRSSNTITLDGVTYTANATTSTDATVSLALNVDGIYSEISNFVSDYNSLIATINSKIAEEYDSSYAPLTDDQKSSMTDTQISNYEEKAKTGLLARDSTLKSFLTDLRSALIDSISGVSTSIFDIGIDTGSYDENGKLYITEDTLKTAIQDNTTAVMNLFTQQSSSYSGTTTVRTLTSSELATRYNQEGIAYRFYDVLAKYTSTLKDSSGNKGLLIAEAGITGDSSASNNALSDEITTYAEDITKEEERLSSYEDRIYNQYTNLETYINKMNTQLSALQSYTSSSSG